MTAGRRVWVFGGAGGVGTSTVAGLLALDLAQPGTQSGPPVRVVDWVGDGSPWPAWTQTSPPGGDLSADPEDRGRTWARVAVTPAAETAGLLAGPVEGWVIIDAGRASLRPDRWEGWRPDGPVILVVSSAEGPIYRAERAARLAATAREVTVVVTDLCDGRRPPAVKAGVTALAAHHRVINVAFDRALRVGGLGRPEAVSARTWKAVVALTRHLDDRSPDQAVAVAVGEGPADRGTGEAAVDLTAAGLRAGSFGRPGDGGGADSGGAVLAGAEREEIRR